MKGILIGIALLFLIGLNAIGLVSLDTRFASANDFRARHTERFTDPIVIRRTEKRVQDTRHLCDRPYPGPGGKDDCEMSKKLLANPKYIKS